MADLTTEPCPDRIIFHTGCFFVMGAVGGTAFHFPKGLYNSPRGARFIGGAQAVRMNARAPRLGGYLAVWGGLVSTFECALGYARQKEDPWNSILAGAAANGLLSMRKGFGPMARAGLGGAAFFAFLEGIGITLTKFAGAQQQMTQVMFEEAPQMGDKAQQAAAPSWFGGFIGQKKEESLESFDSPMPPTFDFE